MSKKIKAFQYDALRKSFDGVRDYVIVEPMAVDAAADYNFRKNLRAKNIKAQLVKNTFARKVFGENGLEAGDVWAGTTLLCWGGANIKELSNAVDEQVKASKKDPKSPEKYKVKIALADGEAISIEDAKKRPTREEAIGDIVSALMSAGSAIAGCLVGPGGELVSILKTIEEKGPAGPAAEAAPAPETDAAAPADG